MESPFRSLSDPIKYGFGVGRVKVLETRLLDHSILERLIEANGLKETLRILGETEYSRFFEEIESASDLEKFLTRYLLEIYQLLSEICPNSELVSFFLLKYDFHNLKVWLKAEYLNESPEEMLLPLGELDLSKYGQAIRQGSWQEIPSPYRSALKEAAEKYLETKDGQVIDLILDRELYHQLYLIALREGREFLTELVKKSIDLANIKIFLRAKFLGKEKSFLALALVDYGMIEKKFYFDIYDHPWQDLAGYFSRTPYDKFVSPELALSHFDRMADNFLLESARQAKFISIGPEPLIGYILAKENEVKLIRLIVMGKLGAWPKKAIRERMRELYA